MMTENWLIPEKLCSFDEKVRVELGPQIIELDCNDENLSDEVTAPHYKEGGIDAHGKAIESNNGGKMHCVDWRAKHVPHVWKVYQLQETDDKDGDDKPISRFIKVAEIADKDDAIEYASTLAGEM